MVAEREWSKEDLAREFGITRNTVYDTLKACGLDTSKRKYTATEVEQFRLARKLLEGGTTYDEVGDHFGLKDAADEQDEEDTRPRGTQEPQGTQFIDDITQEIENSVRAIVAAGVKDLIPYIPQIAASALEEAARSGLIREAFAKHRQAYVRGRNAASVTQRGGLSDDTEHDLQFLEADVTPDNPETASTTDELDNTSPS